MLYANTVYHIITCMTLLHYCIDYGELRIYGGGNYGRLEFRQRDGQWGTVCSQGFDVDAADVACEQLGYSYGHYSSRSSSQ